MAKFSFRLEPVLRQRCLAEQGKQRAVAVVERERLALEDELRSLQGVIAEEKQHWRRAIPQGTGVIDVQELRLRASSASGLDMRAQRLAIKLAGVLQRLSVARDELNKATAARKAMELLRERRYDAWKREVEQRESRLIDDISMGRIARGETGETLVRPSGGKP